MINRSFAVLLWLVNLFDPPPLESMSRAQKVGRVFLVALALAVSCVLLAMVGTLAIFMIEKGRQMLASLTALRGGAEIILIGVLVNALCIVVLLQIRKADRRLMGTKS